MSGGIMVCNAFARGYSLGLALKIMSLSGAYGR
jgi:hypothetical protein